MRFLRNTPGAGCSITLDSHLQACGIINDHERGCFLYKKIMDTHPHAYKLTDG
ncbi:hypothetical protein [Eisenbergiella sp.]